MDSESGRVIRFPGTQEKVSPKAPRQIQNVDGIKYYTDQQIKLLRRTARDQAALDIERGQVTAIREWMAIDLVTSSGLSVWRQRTSDAAT